MMPKSSKRQARKSFTEPVIKLFISSSLSILMKSLLISQTSQTLPLVTTTAPILDFIESQEKDLLRPKKSQTVPSY